MDILPLIWIVSATFTGLTRGAGVLPDGPLKAAVGETVMFTTTLSPPETPFVSVSWQLGTINIITFSGKNVTSPQYEGRITLFMSTGSLELRNVTVNDSGEYRVTVTPFGEAQAAGTITLGVYEPVSNVKVNVSNTDLVESISSVRLSCSSSGSSLSFLWLNGSSEVTGSDRVQLTDGGSTLTIANVTRYDQGPFRCRVFNPVSNGISDPVHLLISYGPDNMNLTVSPPTTYHEERSDVILTCSADSRPAALFTWFLDGDLLSDTGRELRLMDIQMSQSGNYSCQAFNNRTMRYERSQAATISILKKISGASITPEANLPIEGKSYNLTCDAAGSVFTRTWKKGNVYLTPDDDINLYDNNRVLSFKNLSERNDGKYSCEVSNPLSSDKATFVMLVNYGPKNVHIEGPSVLHVGQTLTLTCFAKSHPSASLIWIVNGTEKQKSNVFTKADAQLDDSGNYTCVARNDVTGRTSSAVHGLSVTVKAPFRCGAGCIVGIVIALLVIAGAAAGAAYYFNKKKNPMNKVFKRNIANSTGDDNSSYVPNQELHYSDISVFQKKDGVREQQVNNTSEYAQIQVNMNAASAPSFPAGDVHLQQLKRSATQPDDAQLYSEIHKNSW